MRGALQRSSSAVRSDIFAFGLCFEGSALSLPQNGLLGRIRIVRQDLPDPRSTVALGYQIAPVGGKLHRARTHPILVTLGWNAGVKYLRQQAPGCDLVNVDDEVRIMIRAWRSAGFGQKFAVGRERQVIAELHVSRKRSELRSGPVIHGDIQRLEPRGFGWRWSGGRYGRHTIPAS